MKISPVHGLIVSVFVLPLVMNPPNPAPAASSPAADTPAASSPAANDNRTQAADANANPVYRKIAEVIGTPGVVQQGVYTITLPREDLEIFIDGDQVPVGAGLSSVFYFYRGCCGLTYVAGRFCVLDYEVNDVLDSLRKANIRVGSVANVFVHDKPEVMVIHFQGDEDLDAMLAAIKDALGAIGPARNAPQKID